MDNIQKTIAIGGPIAFANCSNVNNCVGNVNQTNNILVLTREEINQYIDQTEKLSKEEQTHLFKLLDDFEKKKNTRKLKRFLAGLGKIAYDCIIPLISGFVGKLILSL